jgi:hypothetical protein
VILWRVWGLRIRKKNGTQSSSSSHKKLAIHTQNFTRMGKDYEHRQRDKLKNKKKGGGGNHIQREKNKNKRK